MPDASLIWLGGAVVFCLLVILATGTDLAIGAVQKRKGDSIIFGSLFGMGWRR